MTPFPELSPADFRQALYRIHHTPRCTLDKAAAARWLGVDVTTIRRWCTGRQRIPRAVQMLVYLLAEGELTGIIEGWDGWRFNCYDQAGRRVFELVDETGQGYTPGQIRASWWRLRQIEALERRIEELEEERERGLTLPQRRALAAVAGSLKAALDTLETVDGWQAAQA